MQFLFAFSMIGRRRRNTARSRSEEKAGGERGGRERRIEGERGGQSGRKYEKERAERRRKEEKSIGRRADPCGFFKALREGITK